ncbi:MAG TPA: hypothetical protein VIW47_06680 [Nitrospiraceae bacterium]
MEILLYQPDDPTDLENDADQEMMRQLANRFTARRGLVKALTGFGSIEQQSVDRAPLTPGYPRTGSGADATPTAMVDSSSPNERPIRHAVQARRQHPLDHLP